MGFENWDFCERVEVFTTATQLIGRLNEGLSLREAIDDLRREAVNEEAIRRALTVLRLVLAIHVAAMCEGLEAQKTQEKATQAGREG